MDITLEVGAPDLVDEIDPSRARVYIRRLRSSPTWTPLLLGLAISLLVCYPWLHGGRLLLLDWVFGPRSPVVPPAVYGLQGGLLAGYPYSFVVDVLNRLTGNPSSVIPIFLFFPLASVSVSRLVNRGAAPNLLASLLFCINPFVYDRIYVGQIALLIGYALLPFALKALLRLMEGKSGWPSVSLWWWTLIAISPHYLWIFGVPVAVVLVFGHPRVRTLKQLTLATVATAISCSYLYFAGSAGGVGFAVGLRNLAAYRTRADSHLGLFANALGLYGFWRRGPALAKDLITGWPFLLLALVLITAFGYVSVFRKSTRDERVTHKEERSLALVAITAGILGLLLALGDQGPTGGLFRWMYVHVPFFAIMREPEKFSILWSLTLALGFGWGADAVIKQSKGRGGRIVMTAVLTAIPIIYEPLLFGGLAGQVSTSSYPSSWRTVQDIVGHSTGRILVLPWHQYMAFPFTGKRVIANPGVQYFGESVIQGDNVELPKLPTSSTSQRSAFLNYLFREGPVVREFGKVVAPLGIHYIVLFKTVDWKSYFWLANQSDLKRIYDSSTSVVYRNLAFRGTFSSSTSVQKVQNWGSIVSLAQQGQLTSAPILANYAGPGPVRPSALSAISRESPEKSSSVVVRRTSPYQFVIRAPKNSLIQSDELYSDGWALPGGHVVELAEGNLGWQVKRGRYVSEFYPAYFVFVGEGLSVLSLLVVLSFQALRKRNSVSKARV